MSSNGGLTVTREMQKILDQPGLLSVPRGGQRLRRLYQQESMNFNPRNLSEFGFICYLGILEDVKKKIENGTTPDLKGTETPFRFGYAMLVVAGAQRVQGPPGMPLHHAEVLRYLLTHGVPADVPDIVGYSALHHCAASPQERPKLARVLLENGAAVNLQNRYGETPLFGAFQINLVETIDVLMEFGADLDIPEADNLTARQHFLRCGPQVTAVVTKWIRKRNGEEAPRDGKRCDHCGKTDVALKVCTRCKVARYCNPDCQKKHWPTHKKGCQPFNVSTTVTLKPYYQSFGHTLPTAAFARNIFGYTSDLGPEKNTRAAHVPPNMHPGSSKSIIIKVQVPFGGDVPLTPAQSIGELLIYTKKRDFVCQIRRMDRPADYDRIASVVRTKGVGGAKAYFAAELMSKDELVVKVSEVLAEQPF